MTQWERVLYAVSWGLLFLLTVAGGIWSALQGGA